MLAFLPGYFMFYGLDNDTVYFFAIKHVELVKQNETSQKSFINK
jgi:hypothetical protein